MTVARKNLSSAEGEGVFAALGKFFAILATLLASIVAPLTAVTADGGGPPSLPHAFYGSVTIGSSPAPAGTQVDVYVGGSKVASTTTDASGRYGYSPTLAVTGTNGATVEFYIGGSKASPSYTFSSGAITKLDLTVGGTPGTQPSPPPPPPSPPSPPAPNPPPSPPSSSPPGGSSPSGSGAPPAQSPPPATAGRIAIAAEILGRGEVLTLTQTKMVERETTLASSDGSIALSFKAGTRVIIEGESLTISSEPSPPQPPAGRQIIVAYRFAPAGTSFSPWITLSFKYNPATLPPDVSETSLHIAHWDGSTWQSLTSSVNTQTRTVTAEITHFSVFALVGMKGQAPAPSPARFTITELKVVPTAARPGETIAIVATISNTGESQGSYTATLKINGQVEAEQTVTLQAGETKMLTFPITKDTPGSYQITLGDKASSFTITQPATTPQQPSQQIPWLPLIALGSGSILLLVLIILIARRLGS